MRRRRRRRGNALSAKGRVGGGRRDMMRVRMDGRRSESGRRGRWRKVRWMAIRSWRRRK